MDIRNWQNCLFTLMTVFAVTMQSACATANSRWKAKQGAIGKQKTVVISQKRKSLRQGVKQEGGFAAAARAAKHNRAIGADGRRGMQVACATAGLFGKCTANKAQNRESLLIRRAMQDAGQDRRAMPRHQKLRHLGT